MPRYAQPPSASYRVLVELSKEVMEEIDELAERLQENRQLLLRRFIVDGLEREKRKRATLSKRRREAHLHVFNRRAVVREKRDKAAGAVDPTPLLRSWWNSRLTRELAWYHVLSPPDNPAGNERSNGLFGTIYRLKVKPGKKEQAMSAMTDDNRQIDGFVSAYIYDTGGDELWGAVVFRDEQTYRANANDPEQDKWYRRLRECLEGDPEWHDGTIQTSPTT